MKRILAIALAAGCATSQRAGPAPGPAGSAAVRIDMEPLRIEARRRGDRIETTVVDAQGLFDEGGAALSARDFDAAIALYERLLREFPDSRLCAAALYNAGLAHEGKGDWEGASRRYETVAARFSGTGDALDAEFRLGGAYAEMRAFARSADMFARVAGREGLSLDDRIESLARLGYARFQMGDLGGAEAALRRAIAAHAKAEMTERLDSGFFLSMAHYYLGETRHVQFRAAPVRLPEEQMARDLDEKARLLLDAHAAYIDSIKVKDPTWATAAGYQLGLLYREFYDAMMNAPIPPELSDEARAIYVDLLRRNEKMRSLLEKALSVYEKTLFMAERVGVRNDWVERAKGEVESVRRMLRGDAAPPPVAPPPATPTRDEPPPSFVL